MKRFFAISVAAFLVGQSAFLTPVLAEGDNERVSEQERLAGSIVSGWVTERFDPGVQARFRFTHELATNRIVSIDGIVSLRTEESGVVTSAAVEGWSVGPSNVAWIRVGYTVNGNYRVAIFILTV